MQSATKIKCPVCGRSNTQMERCTFCGSSLKEMAQFTQEGQGQGVPSQGMPPRPQEGSTSPYPSLPGTPTPYPGAGPLPTLTAHYAGFWIRTVAYFIDGLIIGLVFKVGRMGYIAGGGQGDFGISNPLSLTFAMNADFLQALVFPMLATMLLTLAYFTIFLGTWGHTPGKMICRLRVIRADGRNPSYPQALVRTVGYYINICFTVYLGFLWVAIDRRKQGLHDKIAGTFEIRLGPADVRGWTPPPGRI